MAATPCPRLYDHGMSDSTFNITYTEDSVWWWIAGWLLMIAVVLIIAVLSVFYLAGAWLAGRIERWIEGRRRREVQSRPVLR